MATKAATAAARNPTRRGFHLGRHGPQKATGSGRTRAANIALARADLRRQGITR